MYYTPFAPIGSGVLDTSDGNQFWVLTDAPSENFVLTLYQNSAEVNRVDKTNYLTPMGSMAGTLRDECSMLRPSITFQSTDVPNFNYVYIESFGRYYYVTTITSVSQNIWRIELDCDVLMTYRFQIYQLRGVIGRQENDYNPDLIDNQLPTQNNPITQIIDIPSTAFDTSTTGTPHNYLLTVVGA